MITVLPVIENRERKCFYEVADLVSDSAVYPEGFFLGFGVFGKSRRVFEGDVNGFGFAGIEGAFFVSVVADGNDVIKVDIF